MRLSMITLILFLCAFDARAEDLTGRYQVVKEGGMVILLDTVNGKTWRFSEPLEWHPMTFMRSGDASVEPEDSKSALERWAEEAETRKLDLLKPTLDNDGD